MVAHAKKLTLTPQEYLERERSEEAKNEYYDGEIVAMAGGSVEHDFAAGSIYASLHAQLPGKPCVPLTGNMRVSVPDCNCYFYPDTSVACGDAQLLRIDGVQSLTNPVLIVEVLSESTEKADREHKFFCYQAVPSLSTYVLVAQDEPLVQVFEKQSNGKWEYSHYLGLDAVVPLPAIDCNLRLADVYARVGFKATSDTAAMRIMEQKARYDEYTALGEEYSEVERAYDSQPAATQGAARS